MFNCVAELMMVPREQFRLIAQQERVNPKVGELLVVQNAPTSPAGSFQLKGDECITITYDPGSLTNPMELIATFAHEISHALLFTTSETPPGGDDCEEFATDLAVTYFGFGVFGANSAFQFQQYSDMGSGSQGWSTHRLGYLTEAEWGFSLAMFILLSGCNEQEVFAALKPGPVVHAKKSLKYLRQNEHLWSDLPGASQANPDIIQQ